MEEKEELQENEKSLKHEIVSTLIYLAVVFAVTFCIITFVGQRTEVNGSSMESTLSDNDNLIMDKLSYRFSDPKRFDIVIFPYQYEQNTYYIKRIIGLPGETVQIDYDGNIYINGQILKENYGKETILDPGIAIEPITLGEDEYFVLGDNRNNSKDSRDASVGVLHGSDFIGKAILRIWPLNKFGTISK